jgi:TonB-linked SusC/RagA family outer membrane protein
MLVVLLLDASLFAQAYANNTSSQNLQKRISVNAENVPLSKVIKEIAKKANIQLVYSDSFIPKDRIVTTKLNNVPVSKALEEVLSQTATDYIVNNTGQIILIPAKSKVTTIVEDKKDGTITGTVVDAETNEPLPGANVLLNETNQGASADIKGNFKINNVTPGSYTLTVSFIGYKKSVRKITVKGNETLNILVPLSVSAFNMDELVVIGSTIRATRKELGNTVTTLKAKDLDKSGKLISGMQGRIPGAQVTQNSGDPAGGFSITLRGASSIYGSSDPLYVLDGVVISNQSKNVTQLNVSAPGAVMGQNRLADINPDDIESIEVIPGGAAAAIYGSRAANGVVLITSKKGTIGAPKYTYTVGFNVNELRKKVYTNLRGEQFGSATQRLYPIAGVDPNTGALTVGRNFSTDKVPVTRYDYQDQVFHTGTGLSNHLSISGGTNNTQYFASLSRSANEGIVKNTSFIRNSVKLRLHQEITDWINADIGVTYINSLSDEKPDGNVFWSPVNSINITNNIYDITKRDEFGNLQSVEPTRVNPLSIIETFDIGQKVNRVIADGQIHLTPLKGLTVDYIIGVDTYGQAGHIFIPPYPYSPVNTSYYNDGYASEAQNNVTQINNDLNLRYQYQLTDKINLTTYAGFNAQLTREHFQTSQGRALAAFVENISGASNFLGASSMDAKTNIWGYYLQETFDYNKALYITVAGRMDASTAFGEDQRSNFYPKVSASYFVSEEDYWADLGIANIVSSLRLRTSWGQSGNLTAIGPFTRFTQYTPGELTGSTIFNIRNQKGNEDIKPERSEELEFGFDVGFLNDRVNLIGTIYNANIKDLIVPRTLASSEGALSIVENIGKLENKGFELLISTTPYKTSTTEVNLFANYSQNRNKVVEAFDGLIRVNAPGWVPAYLQNGQPLGFFYGFYAARDENGNYLLTENGVLQRERGDLATGKPMRDANGQPTGDFLKKKIGDPNPDYIFSVGANFRYKNFTLNVLVDGMQGFDIFDADKRTRQGVGIGEYAEKELSGELPRGWVWSIYPIEEWRVEDGSFVKIREVSISYKFSNFLNMFENARITLSGRNLYSFDNFFSYDPEINSAGQASYLRYNFGTVPIPRSYSLALTLNF